MEKDPNEWRGSSWQGGENSLWPAKGTPFGKRSKPKLRNKRHKTTPGTRKEAIGGAVIIFSGFLVYLYFSLDAGNYVRTQYLKFFEPEEYQKIIQKIEDDIREATLQEINNLENVVALVPVSDHDKNLEIYKRLSTLAPDVSKYKEKIGFYQAKKNKYESEMRKKVIAARAAAEREKLSTGFHCLSGWDGSHERFKEYVRQRMREPDSFEHIKTYIWRANSAGKNLLKMQYRARNGFGWMNIGTAVAQIDNSSCAFTPVSIE